MYNTKFKVDDIFFFRFSNITWVVGKVTDIELIGSLISFNAIDYSKDYLDSLTTFQVGSEMYTNSKLMCDTSIASILAVAL